jgi:hypothetical protein
MRPYKNLPSNRQSEDMIEVYRKNKQIKLKMLFQEVIAVGQIHPLAERFFRLGVIQ